MNNFLRYIKIHKVDLKLGFGIGMIIGGTVVGMKRAFENSDKIKDDLDEIAVVHAANEGRHKDEYKDDLYSAYKKLGKDVLETVGPTCGYVVAGTCCIVSAHLETKNNLEMVSSALARVTSSLNQTTKQIEKDLGEEEANKYRNQIEEKEVEVCDGDGKVEKKTVSVLDGALKDPYTFIWDSSSSCYKTNPHLRKAFLRSMEAYGDGILDARNHSGKVGYIYLYEILNQMGIDIRDLDDDPVKKRGISHFGWLYDSKHPSGVGNGDGYIEIKDQDVYRFNPKTGYYDKVTLITFNCDGAIDWLVYDNKGRLGDTEAA